MLTVAHLLRVGATNFVRINKNTNYVTSKVQYNELGIHAKEIVCKFCGEHCSKIKATQNTVHTLLLPALNLKPLIIINCEF